MSESDPQGVFLTNLSISQFMNLKFVDVPLGPGLTLVEGKNGQGKTSFLKAIVTLFGDKKYRPRFALRKGARRSRILGKLSNGYQITAYCNDEDEWTKVLENTAFPVGDGRRTIKKPQTQLDILRGELTFNALDYLDMPEDKQLEIYRKLGGANFTDLDAEREEKFAERREVNRALKQEEAALAGMIQFPDAPKKEVSYPKLTEELTAAHAKKAANNELRQAAILADGEHDKALADRQARLADVTRIREQLALAEHAAEAALVVLQEKFNAVEAATATLQTIVEPDIISIQAKINEAAAINEQVRANANRKAAEERLETLRAEADTLTNSLDDIESQKLARLREAEERMPVKGLSLTGRTVLFNNLPLNQMSGSEAVLFCVTIGAALHPQLSTILIDDAEKLNEDRLKMLAEIATSRGLQLIAARACEVGSEGSIQIHDGTTNGLPRPIADEEDEDDELPEF